MAKIPGKLGKLGSVKGLITLGVVVILLGVTTWGIARGVFGGVPTQTNKGAVQLAPAVSPLLFGTNMGLFDSNDQILTSATTRGLLQQMHVRIIRMPVRSSLSEATEVQAAQAIKSLGAVPLVVLRGAVDSTVLADDSVIINDMNRIFGNSVVYYEYGNEEDLLGVDVNGYSTSWNAVVPQLKRLALNGQFVGPVNYHYDRTYLSTFLQRANPRPNQISWHEYTCDDAAANNVCIAQIAEWTNHISDARAAMQSTIGATLPIMLTEWNYAPNAVPNDGKNNNSAFMATWTSTALQTLAANGIFASMQYSATNTAIPMIASNSAPTTQGTTFQSQYQSMVVGGQPPTPIPTTPGQPQPTAPTGNGNGNGNPNPTSTVAPQQFSSFSFEDGGVDGWSGRGEVSVVQNSATVGMGDKHSLQVSLTNMGAGDFPFVSVGQANLSAYPRAGQTVTMYVYLPANSPAMEAKLFIMDSQYHWFDPDSMITLQSGTWNRLTLTLPGGVTGQLRQLGVQFNTQSSTPVSGNVYIDAVGWR